MLLGNPFQRCQHFLIGKSLWHRVHEGDGTCNSIVHIVHQRCWTQGPLAIAAHVPQYRYQPGTTIRPWLESVEGFERLEQCFLNEIPVSYTHLRAHETRHDLVCRLLLE